MYGEGAAMETCFGEIQIVLNGQPIDCKIVALPVRQRQFIVDKRFSMQPTNVFCAYPFILEALIDMDDFDNIEWGSETDERLSANSFSTENEKLSIGVEGDRKDCVYTYLKNGIRICVTSNWSPSDFVFFVAWKKMKDQSLEDDDTWLAVDPC